MAHRLIIKDIENKKIEKIYFLHGEEGFFIDEITKALLKNVLEEHERDFNQAIMYGKDSDVFNIITECKGYPMMAERKLVVLREAQLSITRIKHLTQEKKLPRSLLKMV